MRAAFIRYWAALLVLIPPAHAICADELFPYRAQITSPEAILYSGPGDEYYATDRLASGTIVEVYNEAPGGWLAIRPPSESYSWVFGRHVEVLENGLGRINKKDVASRIGGLESEKREVIQVRLQENELVALADDPNAGDGLWVKIKPPAGEFRWVHADDVRTIGGQVDPITHSEGVPTAPAEAEPAQVSTLPDEPPADNEADQIATDEPAPDTSDGWSRQVAPPEPPLQAQPIAAEVPTSKPQAEPETAPPLPPAVPLNDSGWVVTAAHNEPAPTSAAPAARAASGPTPPPLLDYPPPPARVAEDPRFKAPVRGDSSAGTPERPPRYGVANPTSAAPTTQAAPATVSAATGHSNSGTGDFSPEFAQRLTALEWQLSQTVADDRQKWHLENLERDAEALLTAAQTVAERDAAKHTLTKIDRFASIQRRFAESATAPLAPEGTPNTIGVAPAIAGSPPPVSPPGPQAMTAPATTPLVAAAPATPLHQMPLAATPSSMPPGPRGRTWRYDAEGILQPVRSSRPGAPQYALVDESGRLVTFVTPTPDVDAQPFVGKRVGVVGRSVYLPDLGQPSLTAGRISPLAQPLIR